MVLAGPLENPGYHLPYSDRMLSHDCVDHAGEASSAPSPGVTQLPHLVHVHPVDNRGHLDQGARASCQRRTAALVCMGLLLQTKRRMGRSARAPWLPRSGTKRAEVYGLALCPLVPGQQLTKQTPAASPTGWGLNAPQGRRYINLLTLNSLQYTTITRMDC